MPRSWPLDPNRSTHALTEFTRNTLEFLKQLKDTGEPVTLTIDGKVELVVLDAASCQRLIDRTEESLGDDWNQQEPDVYGELIDKRED